MQGENGDEIPETCHGYARTGDPYRLEPVFHHNVPDLVVMAEPLVRPLG
jgi:hypothetical protein